MADTAVRVDIIVGQNTVVPSVERTEAALRGVTRSAGTLNGGFENLSTRGMRKVEAGFQNIAARAVGLQGPWSKVVEGMLLLGAGSTVVLGVAAGTALVAKAIELIGKKSKEAERAFKGATVALEEFLNPKNPLQGSIDVIAEKISILQMRMLSTFDPKLLAQYNAEMVRLQKLLGDVGAKQAGASKPAPAGKAGKAGESEGAFGQRMTNALAVTIELAPQAAEGLIALRDVVNTLEPTPVEMIGEAVRTLDQDLLEIIGFTLPELATAFGLAFIDAVAGANSFAEATIGAVRKAIAGTARMLGQEQFAKAAAKFAEGTWPPNPLAIASALKHVAAGALFNALAGAVGGGSGAGAVGGSAARGGVDSARMNKDQSAMTRGTVTVTMGRDGFIRPSDPVFQEFLAQVIKEAKGRNVVFA